MIGPQPSPLASMPSKVYTCRALGCGASEPGRPHEPPGWGYSVDGSQRCPVHHRAEVEAMYSRINAEREAFYARLRGEAAATVLTSKARPLASAG